ncbi:MAG: hypothetical protein D8M57_04425 [Candidatus Scalindua sp. AMX11]|nr:MAG: hypothetical protein DWQ00_04170 [Candidatus Scalindua sp.]TDE66062.1 MAG: hypothetical protein D8M57_04425 [Candidatus Scalindua sp. AMX11]
MSKDKGLFDLEERFIDIAVRIIHTLELQILQGKRKLTLSLSFAKYFNSFLWMHFLACSSATILIRFRSSILSP